jgi:hypothetical protein
MIRLKEREREADVWRAEVKERQRDLKSDNDTHDDDEYYRRRRRGRDDRKRKRDKEQEDDLADNVLVSDKSSSPLVTNHTQAHIHMRCTVRMEAHRRPTLTHHTRTHSLT